MPFVEPTDLLSTGRPLAKDNQLLRQAEPDFWDQVVPAAFRRENTFVSAIANEVRTPPLSEFDPDFDPFDVLPEHHVGFEDRYAKAFNAEHAFQIRQQIERELEDTEILSASGFAGGAAALAAGVFDPVNLIPIGGAAYRTYRTGGSILRGAGATALAGMSSATLAEIGLQATQETRTLGESAINVAAATVLSGIIGTGAATLARQRGEWTRLVDTFKDNDMRPIDARDGNLSSAESRSVVDAETGELRSTTVEEEGIAGGRVVQSVARAAAVVDPTLAVATSTAKSTRVEAQKLVETTVQRGINREGLESDLPAEAIARSYQRNLYQFLKGLDEDFVEYAKGRSKRFGDIAALQAARVAGLDRGKVSFQEFRQLVGRAARRGDSAEGLEITDPVLKQAVEKAARRYRSEVVEPLKDKAIELKLLSEDVDVKTAESYVNRVWNTTKLRAEQGKFIDTTVEWLRSRRTEAATREASFATAETELKKQISTARQTIRTTHNTTYRETMEDTLREAEATVFDLFLDFFSKGFKVTTKTETELVEAAKEAAMRAFTRNFREKLARNLQKVMDTDAAEFEDLVVREAIRKVGDDVREGADIEETLKDIALPISSALGEGNSAAVLRSLDDAIREAGAAAKTAADKLLARRIQRAKGGETESQAFDRFIRELSQSVRTAGRKASNKAAAAATKELRKDLQTHIKALAKLRKQQTRDLFERDLTDDDLRHIATEIHSRLINTPAGRLPYDLNINDIGRAPGRQDKQLAGQFKRRAFLIPDDMVEDWLEDDIELLSKQLIRGMAPDIGIAAKFDGDVSMEAAIKNIRDEWSEIIRKAEEDGATPQEVAKLGRQRDRDILNITILRDRLRNVHGVPDDPLAWGPRIGSTVRKLNYIRLLGGMTVSAIPDLARVMMVNGFDNAFRDVLAPMLKSWTDFTRVTAEIRDLGLAADMLLNSRANAIADIADDYHRLSKFERGVGALSDTFGMVSLMSPWNTVLKQLAGATTQARMIRAIRADAAGTISKKERAYLRENYISKDLAKRIADQISNHGKKSENGLELSGWTDWTDRSAADAFQAGMQREVNKIIITPGSDMAAISFRGKEFISQKTEVGKMLLQFKSFIVAATQRMLLAGLQQNDAHFYGGMLMSVTLGMMVFNIKARAQGLEIPDPLEQPQKWLFEGIDRSGIAGWFFEPNNILEKVTGGNVGISRLLGVAPMSRFASRNAVGALLGPSFGTASTLFSVTAAASGALLGGNEWTDADTHALRRLLPYQNLIGARHVFDAVERGLSTGVPR